jgi:hypothetical protein
MPIIIFLSKINIIKKNKDIKTSMKGIFSKNNPIIIDMAKQTSKKKDIKYAA